MGGFNSRMERGGGKNQWTGKKTIEMIQSEEHKENGLKQTSKQREPQRPVDL